MDRPSEAQTAFLKRVDQAARAALPRWGFGPGATPTLINHSENVTYRVDEPERCRCAILRVHRPGYHDEARIGAELQWLAALAEDRQVVTARVIPALDGRAIQTLTVAGPRDVACHAVLFTFLSGREPAEDDLLGPFERLGAVTARLHRHANAWRSPAGFVRPRWDVTTMLGPQPIWGNWRHGLGMDGGRRRQLQRLADCLERRLARFGDGPERFGLIHADLRLANLLLEGEVTKVIDFDDCGFGWYLYDLAAALSFIEDRPDVPALVEAWLRGYRRVAPLPAEEAAEIPTFVMLRRLLLVAWCGSHAETELAQAMGHAFTEGSCTLAEAYLRAFA